MRDSSFIFSDNEFSKDNDDLLLNLEDTYKKDKKENEINERQKIVVTGAAGFIGFHLSKRLLTLGYHVLGIDNLNDYYDVSLKEARLKILKEYVDFEFEKLDICDFKALKERIGTSYKTIIHLAAQAGVRYSIENPWTYVQNNVMGHLNILEVCRGIESFDRLIYASSSSVYGLSNNLDKSSDKSSGYSINDRVDQPVSLYAATKKADELMSYTYSHLYGINAVGLRFFTVYAEYARPDMAPMLFTKKILEEQPINVFNHGDLKRDFTYVDDIVDGILGVMHLPLKENSKSEEARSEGPERLERSERSEGKKVGIHRIYNLGNHNPVKLLDFIELLEKHIGKKAEKIMLPMQKGDVYETYADISESERDFNFKPRVPLDEGLNKLVKWYKEYYQFDVSSEK